jgi:tetratricopeptide (TPR) repeat protein
MLTSLPFFTGAADARIMCSSGPTLKSSFQEQIQFAQMIMHIPKGNGGVGADFENRADGYYCRGILYHWSGKYELAISDYTSAIGWRRNFEDAFEARGDAYEDLGQHGKAAADYAEAASLHADDPGKLAGRCWARAVRGHPLDRALADCNAALTDGGGQVALYDRCYLYFRMRNYVAAIADCTKAAAMTKGDNFLLYLDGVAQPDSRGATGRDFVLYLGGVAKLRSGDTTGGNADIAEAMKGNSKIADWYALYEVKP